MASNLSDPNGYKAHMKFIIFIIHYNECIAKQVQLASCLPNACNSHYYLSVGLTGQYIQ